MREGGREGERYLGMQAVLDEGFDLL